MKYVAVTLGTAISQHAARVYDERAGPVSRAVCGLLWDTEIGTWPQRRPKQCLRCKRVFSANDGRTEDD